MYIDVEGEVADFTSSVVDSIRDIVAAAAGVHPGDVRVSVWAASVLIVAAISVQNAGEAAEVTGHLSAAFATEAATEERFSAGGVPVDINRVPQVYTQEVSPDPPTAPPPPPSSPVLSFWEAPIFQTFTGTTLVVVCAAVLVLCIFAAVFLIWRERVKMARRRKYLEERRRAMSALGAILSAEDAGGAAALASLDETTVDMRAPPPPPPPTWPSDGAIETRTSLGRPKAQPVPKPLALAREKTHWSRTLTFDDDHVARSARWIATKTEAGETYYYNVATNDTAWEIPGDHSSTEEAHSTSTRSIELSNREIELAVAPADEGNADSKTPDHGEEVPQARADVERVTLGSEAVSPVSPAGRMALRRARRMSELAQRAASRQQRPPSTAPESVRAPPTAGEMRGEAVAAEDTVRV